MVWQIEWRDIAVKQFSKLVKPAQKQIQHYLREKLCTNEHPMRFGKALIGDKSGLWRYRVGDYRIICKIEDTRMTILVVTLGHRKEVYDYSP